MKLTDGEKKIKIITINDPVTKIVFGSMLGHLYDLGLCPFKIKVNNAFILIRKLSSFS